MIAQILHARDGWSFMVTIAPYIGVFDSVCHLIAFRIYSSPKAWGPRRKPKPRIFSCAYVTYLCVCVCVRKLGVKVSSWCHGLGQLSLAVDFLQCCDARAAPMDLPVSEVQ